MVVCDKGFKKVFCNPEGLVEISKRMSLEKRFAMLALKFSTKIQHKIGEIVRKSPKTDKKTKFF